MLMPSRTKYRKVRKGKIHGGKATSLSTIAYGKYALVSNSSERITAPSCLKWMALPSLWRAKL
jgi:ribosomal protein L16/L10AE